MIETSHASTLEAPSDAARVDEKPTSFHDLELSPSILKILDKLKFVTPTPIQARAIPVALTGCDVIGIAQTGTGKTLAFGLPILQRMVSSRLRGRALIVVPTRELALQVEQALAQIGDHLDIKTCVLIGGANMRAQQNDLRRNPDIIVATPGRLIDHLQSGYVDLRSVETLVLDEADRMLDMGFAPQIRQIVRATPDERQTLLFSATMPDPIVKMANEFQYQPERVEVERPGTSASGVTQEIFIVPQDEKKDLLSKVLYEYEGSVLVFARTRSRARRVARDIQRWDISAAEIHADRTLVQRRAALDGFKSGRYRVLVATDIAARGIDVTGIELVVNFDLPDCADDYVHRIGRTGRAGKTGHAISFACPDQSADVRDIEKLIRQPLQLSPHNLGEFDASVSAPRRGRSPRGNGGRPRQTSNVAPHSHHTAQTAAHPHDRMPRQSSSTQGHTSPGAMPHGHGSHGQSPRGAKPTSNLQSKGRVFKGRTASSSRRGASRA